MASANLWLFGGNGTQGLTNDLWEFTPGMAQWSLISGTQTANTNGIYGYRKPLRPRTFPAAAARRPSGSIQRESVAIRWLGLWRDR